jgi:hypothetical protein
MRAGVFASGLIVLIIGLILVGIGAGVNSLAGLIAGIVLAVIGAPLTGVGAALHHKESN